MSSTKGIMSTARFGYRTLASIAAAVVVVVSTAVVHGFASQSTLGTDVGEQRVVEPMSCPGTRDDLAGDPSVTNQQEIAVRVAATALLRVDNTGRVTSAATNSGCPPRQDDDVYIVRPDGSIEAATRVDIDSCEWAGSFAVPGRFEPQSCEPIDVGERTRQGDRRPR